MRVYSRTNESGALDMSYTSKHAAPLHCKLAATTAKATVHDLQRYTHLVANKHVTVHNGIRHTHRDVLFKLDQSDVINNHIASNTSPVILYVGKSDRR